MGIATLIRIGGGSFTTPSDASDAARAAAVGALELGAVASLNPFYAENGTVLDGIDATRSWSLAGSEPNDPAPTSIGQSPAQQYVHDQARRWRSSFTRPAGSFSVVLTYAVSPDEAATMRAVLFACGADGDTGAVLNARHQNSRLHFFADNVDAHGVIDTGLVGGGRTACFSYDAATGIGAVTLATGDPITVPFSAPPSGQPWTIGGWSDGYGFAGKLGASVLIFDRAFHTDANRPAAQRLLAALNAAHGLA
jgi:hypothetical protein